MIKEWYKDKPLGEVLMSDIARYYTTRLLPKKPVENKFSREQVEKQWANMNTLIEEKKYGNLIQLGKIFVG
jgi:hypothetical protein